MGISSLEFFMKLPDKDLIQIYQAGKLPELCYALSLDLQSLKINTPLN